MYVKFDVFISNLCLLIYLEYVSGQVLGVQQQLDNKLACIDHDECGACLSAASHCRWCADRYFKSTVPRCNDDDSLVNAGCSQSAIQRPEAPVWQVFENRSLQDMPSDSQEADKVIQIQPQKIKLSLKPQQTKKIKFSYRPAKNYPLDLYYLMDLTWSMKDDKETLVSLGDAISVMLKNLTVNFRLGFGSFAEKPLMPFISTDALRRANPCTTQTTDDGMTEVCDATYSFKHHLSLTNQVSDFINEVSISNVTANLDNAEAQLEALMQVLSCGEKIGWSPRSRKIVILSSDGHMHTAGDGLLAGATKRNDEKCHLDEEGYYTESAIYDYPSLAQVYRLLDKYKVRVIFAVTEAVKGYYDKLPEPLTDFIKVAKLESDSSNILELVKTGYDEIVSVVSFEDNSSLGPLKVKYFTDCGVAGQPLKEASLCTGVGFGMTLNYEAHISLESCPEFRKSIQTIKISESQLGQDSLTLEVDIQCWCECQHTAQEDESVTCGANKHLVCGVCLCNKGWSGPDCNCSTENEVASAALDSQCREPNATRSIACSGAGECLCGKCDCDRGYSGRYCQCRACDISRENGLQCGGEEQGLCMCGVCACKPGWSGDTCSCTNSTDTCVAPGGGDVCSGRGDCVCGRCQCSSNTDGSKYVGSFCETCATCVNPLCLTAEPCVACHMNSSCTDLCTIGNLNYTVTERFNDTGTVSTGETSCILRRDEDGQECEYTYTYTADSKAMVAMEIAIRSKQCFITTAGVLMSNALMIVGFVIAAGIVVILAVKSAQIVSDRRAYAKFVQEAQESRKNMQELNPLYISPISEFKLPDSYPRDKND